MRAIAIDTMVAMLNAISQIQTASWVRPAQAPIAQVTQTAAPPAAGSTSKPYCERPGSR